MNRSKLGIREISRMICGDMILIYEEDEKSGQAGFYLIPTGFEERETEDKFYRLNSMVQYKLVGDIYPGAYGNGATYHNSESAKRLRYDSQTVMETEEGIQIDTLLRDERGYEMHHLVTWHAGESSVEIKSLFRNQSEQEVTLEAISSFELSNITPFVEKDAPETLLLHRLRSKWSHEGRLVTETIEDLQLEPSWSTWAVSVERYGQTGSMPVKKYFPFAAVEDQKTGVVWAVQLAHEASWQMEVYRQDDALHLCGGLADREFGHWMKKIEAGGAFETPTAIVTVCAGDIDRACQRLTQAGQKYADQAPESEQELPIIFNEYCTTWGSPSHENIKKILDVIRDRGFSYFVIDCGWFREAGVPWDISMGDYQISPDLFPEGLDQTVKMITEAGMKAGIWFEIDNVGRAARAYASTEHMLKKDGIPITTENRRFWDMRDPWVISYLEERVIGTLRQYGFSYMKMDYNDTIGIGCDGCESLGEGLRQNMEASVNFVRRVREQIPGIILENCSSGGHKLEPLMMSLTSMASFSDAHECPEIPIIAANLHRAILPRQSQIWAVIRNADTTKRIAYSLAATFLGRMCLSGDVTELSPAQWDVIDRGMAFYRTIAPIIKYGYSYRYGTKITSERHPRGWQGLLRLGENGEAFCVIHTFGGELPEEISIPLPPDCPRTLAETYGERRPDFRIEGEKLIYHPTELWQAAALRLTAN